MTPAHWEWRREYPSDTSIFFHTIPECRTTNSSDEVTIEPMHTIGLTDVLGSEYFSPFDPLCFTAGISFNVSSRPLMLIDDVIRVWTIVTGHGQFWK
jgi:hypothetical protein